MQKGQALLLQATIQTHPRGVLSPYTRCRDCRAMARFRATTSAMENCIIRLSSSFLFHVKPSLSAPAQRIELTSTGYYAVQTRRQAYGNGSNLGEVRLEPFD